jgi:hypothetical protein
MILEYQYDSYDDEYDDTYDYSDIKLKDTPDIDDMLDNVTIEPPKIEVESVDPIKNYESRLVGYLQKDSSFFSQNMRKSVERVQFCTETGLTNQQIEGWYSFLERNPRKKAKILEKYEWQGNTSIQESQNEKVEPVDSTRTSSPAQRGKGRNHGRKKGHIYKLQKGMGGRTD